MTSTASTRTATVGSANPADTKLAAAPDPPSLVGRLVWKDWHFHRGTIALAFVSGAIALGLVGAGSPAAFYVGSVLYFTLVAGLGITLVLMTVVHERKEQTLPFVMSLPISITEYTKAKIIANLTIYTVPWLGLVIGGWILVVSRSSLPDGLLPLLLLLSLGLFFAYCLMLAIALVTESEGWTVVAIVISNLCFNFFLYWLGNLPGFGEHINTEVPVWDGLVWTIAGTTVGLSVLCLVVTFYLQSRKADFI